MTNVSYVNIILTRDFDIEHPSPAPILNKNPQKYNVHELNNANSHRFVYMNFLASAYGDPFISNSSKECATLLEITINSLQFCYFFIFYFVRIDQINSIKLHFYLTTLIPFLFSSCFYIEILFTISYIYTHFTSSTPFFMCHVNFIIFLFQF